MVIARVVKLMVLAGLTLLTSVLHAAPDIEHWQSPSGAQVYYVHAPGLPIVDLQITFNAGSARDGVQSGLSSITSHMLGMGAGGLDATMIAQRFEGVGAQFSQDSDRDMAWLKLRSLAQGKWLDPAVNTLALILSDPNFDKQDFERERKRYLNSLKREKQDPGSVATRIFYKAVYGNHPYANMPNGTEETLQSMTVADLKRFFGKYYVARNATVSIVGDIERKAAEALVARVLKKLPGGEAAAALPKVEELQKARVIRIAHPSTQTHILMGHPGNYRGDADYFAMYIGNHALGGSGLVSRLSDEIREKRGLSYSVYSYYLPLARKGVFQVSMQTRNDQAEQGLKVLRKTMQEYVDKGMTAAELQASRKNITGGFPLRIDSNKKILGYLAMIGFYKLPLTYLDDFNNNVEAVSLQQIQDTMRRRLDVERMVTVIVGGDQ